MATLSVTTREELLSALSSAAGGDSIVLGAGQYGTITIDGRYAAEVKIVSETPLAAKFTSITLNGAENVHLDGIHIDAPDNGQRIQALLDILKSRHITVANSEINGLVDDDFDGWRAIHMADGTRDVTLENNHVHDVFRGTLAFGVQGLRIVENDFTRVGDDAMKFGGVRDVLVRNNFSEGPAKQGSHIDFMQFQGDPSHDVTIVGNVLLPTARKNIQGIFFGTEGHDVLIEENIIHSSMRNGIHFADGSGVVARNNTVLNTGTGITTVSLPDGSVSSGNVYNTRLGAGSFFRDDYIVQAWDGAAPGYVTSLYRDGDAGAGLTLETLGIEPNGLGQFVGAVNRIRELTGDPVAFPLPSGPPPATATTLLAIDGSTSFDGTPATVITVAPGANFAVPAATIAFSFSADAMTGKQGLVSKDAWQFLGGGNQFSVSLDDNALSVVFESDTERQKFTVRGLRAEVEYDVHASFGDGKIVAWLDDRIIGFANFTTDWGKNREYLQIGAQNDSMLSGTSGFNNPFDGTMSDLRIVSGLMTPEQLALVEDPVIPPGNGLVFVEPGPMQFGGVLDDTVTVAHRPDFELATGTISFKFRPDSVAGVQGLISKEATGAGIGAGDFSAWLEEDTIRFRILDIDETRVQFRRGDIEAGLTYRATMSFDGTTVSCWLNQTLIAKQDFAVDLTDNDQILHFGASGWWSPDQQSLPQDPFDGTISDVVIFDKVLTPADLI